MLPEWVFLSPVFFFPLLFAKWTPWLIACFSIWVEVSGGVCVITSVSWLCVTKEIFSKKTLLSHWWYMILILKNPRFCVFLEVWKTFEKDKKLLFTERHLCFFPQCVLINAAPSRFLLIKSDNIWCERKWVSFNVANATAGVILAILAVYSTCWTFKGGELCGGKKKVLNQPLWNSLQP